MKEPENNTKNSTNPSTEENVNVIYASPETIELRKKEFEEMDIKLDHLERSEQKKLHSILRDNFQAFSNSLKSLGHTDLIVPQIKALHSDPK